MSGYLDVFYNIHFGVFSNNPDAYETNGGPGSGQYYVLSAADYESVKFKNITEFSIFAFMQFSNADSSYRESVAALTATVSEMVGYAQLPERKALSGGTVQLNPNDAEAYAQVFSSGSPNADALKLLRFGALISAAETNWRAEDWNGNAVPPYARVFYSDDTGVLTVKDPEIVSSQNGEIANLRKTRICFALTHSISTIERVTASQVSFEWTDSDNAVHTIQGAIISSDPGAIVVEFNTSELPVGQQIKWRLAVYTTAGYSSEPVYSDYVFSESVAATISVSPSGGYVSPTASNIFSWSVDQAGAVPQTKAELKWRSGTSGTFQTITINGATQSYTFPANTFPKGTIQWSVTVYTELGATISPGIISLYTQEPGATVEALEPNGTVVESTSPILFRWSHIVETGTPQTKAELQWSADKSTWTALATITGSARSWTAPANTFTAGTRYWRVRTYNSDNVASSWSDAATFICVGAPAAPVVVIQELSPRPKISWQVDGQQAYQVELVGIYSDGTRFGRDKQWQSPLYLADGDYTVRVRVQNEYGFWSAWGVAPLQIINTPGSAITLTAETGREVTLAWTASGFDYYIVYRDGVAIARTTETLYTDRTSIGQVKYQVRGCYATSANYSLSDAVTVTVSTPSVCLYDLDAEQWVDLRYDASAHRSTAYSLARDIQYMQLSGRTYPVAERSEFVQRSLRVACVCFTADDRARMLSMLGHLVCVKTPEGNMVTGYVANLSETSDDFFSTYGFDVAQADVKEEIDIDEA